MTDNGSIVNDGEAQEFLRKLKPNLTYLLRFDWHAKKQEMSKHPKTYPDRIDNTSKETHMKSSQWKAGTVVAGLVVGLGGSVLHAQPGGNGIGQNPPNDPQGGRRGNRPPITPEQRQQWMQQMQ